MNSNLYTAEDMLMTYLFCRFTWLLEKFKSYLNSKHRNIRFTYEKEHNNSMPFLDVLITRSSNGFKTSVYYKPTFIISLLSYHFIISKVFNCFEFFQFSFRSVSFKRNIKKEPISYQIGKYLRQILSQWKTHWETGHINCWSKRFCYYHFLVKYHLI